MPRALQSLAFNDLRRLAKASGVSAKGTKAELVERLEQQRDSGNDDGHGNIAGQDPEPARIAQTVQEPDQMEGVVELGQKVTSDTSQVAMLAKMTLKLLQAKCKAAGLSTLGKKAVLIERLTTASKTTDADLSDGDAAMALPSPVDEPVPASPVPAASALKASSTPFSAYCIPCGRHMSSPDEMGGVAVIYKLRMHVQMPSAGEPNDAKCVPLLIDIPRAADVDDAYANAVSLCHACATANAQMAERQSAMDCHRDGFVADDSVHNDGGEVAAETQIPAPSAFALTGTADVQHNKTDAAERDTATTFQPMDHSAGHTVQSPTSAMQSRLARPVYAKTTAAANTSAGAANTRQALRVQNASMSSKIPLTPALRKAQSAIQPIATSATKGKDVGGKTAASAKQRALQAPLGTWHRQARRDHIQQQLQRGGEQEWPQTTHLERSESFESMSTTIGSISSISSGGGSRSSFNFANSIGSASAMKRSGISGTHGTHGTHGKFGMDPQSPAPQRIMQLQRQYSASSSVSAPGSPKRRDSYQARACPLFSERVELITSAAMPGTTEELQLILGTAQGKLPR
ncbi:hypothetical protein BC831DRAFT_443913 [Entophlyctis helioformis]|nr:hypothetical protein BC831DRAFT_443913 [Entophlyctis helioformis]